MRYAFSGPTNPPDDARGYIASVILLLDNPTGFVTGAAYGVDTIAYEESVRFFPDAAHTVCAPAGKWHNRELVDLALERGHEVIMVPGGYMARNDALIARCDRLVAFPPTMVEVVRGGDGAGTWATIRRARKAKKPIQYWPFDPRKSLQIQRVK